MLRPVRTLDVDLEKLAGAVFTPGARAIGTDGTASLALPGPFPGKVAHVAADGRVTVAEGRLVADAPLRFVRDADRMRAVAFDGGTTYAAIERVTAAVPWFMVVAPATVSPARSTLAGRADHCVVDPDFPVPNQRFS